MTLANVIGSSIVNILLIIGVATIVKPIMVKERVVKKESQKWDSFFVVNFEKL